ncbi:hypothetical protein [Kiloniella antarctica]|uniref:YggT family protein n=1 Tax=Kiloniella antarctica TaxID=1550907 RepID=A0ABW5BHS7_9PROT
MDELKNIMGLFYGVISLIDSLISTIKFIFGWWSNLWTKFYDSKLPLNPIWARVLGIVSSLLTHPLVIILVLYSLRDRLWGPF